jgi:DNA-binding Xre family transcriptional regulator
MPKGTNIKPGELTEGIAHVIRLRMAEVRTNKTRLAGASGIPRTTLGGLVEGTVVFDVEQLDKVCRALNKPIEEVIRTATEATAHPVTDSGIAPMAGD